MTLFYLFLVSDDGVPPFEYNNTNDNNKAFEYNNTKLIIKAKGMIDDVVIVNTSGIRIILTKSTSSSLIPRCITSLEHDF